MTGFKRSVSRFLSDEQGLTTVEYALAGALVSAVLVTTFTALGSSVAVRITDMANIVR